MKKNPERTAMTRSILIDTFLELSEQKSIDKITVSELSNKAGYNRSTFYQYFNDVFHLLSCIEDDLLLYIKDTVVNQIGKTHLEKTFIDCFIQIDTEKRKMLKLLLDRRTNNHFPIKLKETLIPAFADQMQFDSKDQYSIFILDFYLSGIISVLSRWITTDPSMSPEDYAMLMRKIVEGMRKSELFPVL